jgi:hypothetical protein
MKAIRNTFFDGNSIDINKGDKIKVARGDLTGLTGTVIHLEDGFIEFKPHIEGYTKNLT